MTALVLTLLIIEGGYEYRCNYSNWINRAGFSNFGAVERLFLIKERVYI